MAVNRAVFMRRARRFVSSFLPFILAVSTLSAISVVTAPSANATIPAGAIYDFQATNYNATNGQWTNSGSVSETVTRSALTGTSNPAKGTSPESVEFNGTTNGYQFITSSQYTGPQTQAFSLSVWFRTTSVSGKIIGFENANTATGSVSYDRFLYVGSDGKLYFAVYPGAIRTIDSVSTVNNGVWRNATATFASGTMILYINGTQVSTATNIGSAQDYSGYWRIGGYKATTWLNSPGDIFFSGSIGRATVYHKALTSAEVTSYFTNTRSVYTPSAPSSVSATSNQNGQAAISWNASSSTGGAVTYSVTSSPSVTPPAGCTNTSNTSCTFTGLTNGTTYTFTVTPSNTLGAGATSTATATPATTAGAPTISSVQSNDGSLAVAFTAPSNNGGASVTNYKYSLNNGSYQTISPPSTTSPFTIPGLTNGTSYSVKIRAVNGAGDGAESNAVAGTPLPDCNPATPVSSGGFTRVTFTSVGTCNWRVPESVTSAEVLVVGGGGGGNRGVCAANYGAGAGGGGVYSGTRSSLIPGAKIVVKVGAGGKKAVSNCVFHGATGTSGESGQTSSFDVVSVNGGLAPVYTSLTGGSSGNGNAGGSIPSSGTSSCSSNINNCGAGGGGGASAVGVGLNGGAGVSSDISGSSRMYGGGGPGKNNSVSGSSGNGLYEANFTPTANTGSGGSDWTDGADGVVIVRYVMATLTPTFGTPTATANGFTVQITNFNSGYTWSGTATENGSVAIDGTGLVTVTGVAPGTSSTATITNTTASYTGASATVSGTSTAGSALTPTFGTPTVTADGFTVQITNYSNSYTWAGTASSGVVSVSDNGLLTVSGVAANTSSTATISTTRTGYTGGSATVSATSLPTCAPTSVSNGGYTTLTFTSTSLCTWKPDTGITNIRTLLVGGGGGGGAHVAGGGGGGGVVESTSTSVTPGNSYTIAVGAGGIGAQRTSTTQTASAVGGDTTAFGITAFGGGGGGSWHADASSRATGGGASRESSVISPLNTINPAQGFAGGSSLTSGAFTRDWGQLGYPTGGGGGAGGAGANGGSTSSAASSAGAGGIGKSSNITGSDVYYGGGGGGGCHGAAGVTCTNGAGGEGGGGAGKSAGSSTSGETVSGNSGTANRGGGGGGTSGDWSRNPHSGGAGGSGVVIVRYVSAANTPSLSTPVSTATGFTFNISNYDPSYTYTYSSSPTATVTPGSASGSSLPVTVSGVSPGQSSTITVSTSANGFTASSNVSGSAASNVATLSGVQIKGASATLGTPNSNLANVTSTGTVTITQIAATDTSNSGSFVSSITRTSTSSTAKIVKYGRGVTPTPESVQSNSAYAGTEQIADGDYFIIRVTAQDGTTIQYYGINVTISAPVIATSSSITNAQSAPSVVVTGNDFKSGIALSDLTINVGTSGLTASTVTRNSATQITVAFTGSASAGTITIQAKDSAFALTASSASNTLSIAVPQTSQSTLTVSSTGKTYDPTGLTYALTTSGGSGTGAVTYVVTATGTAGCSVSGTTLTYTSAGTCTVTATKAADTNYTVVSSSATTITFGKANQSTLTLTSTSGTFGSTLSLTSSGGSSAGALSYVVNSGPCTVSGSTLSNSAAGTCSVTATMAGGDNYNNVSSSATDITIAKANQNALTITSTSAAFGATLSLTTSGGSSAGAVTFATATAGCSISGSNLTSTSAQTCVVTATMAGGTNYNNVSSSATDVVFGKANQSTLTLTSTSGTFGSTLSLTSSGGSSSGAVTFATSTAGCSISGSNLTSTSAQTCVVTATMAGGDNYNNVSSSATNVVFGKANQSTLTLTSTSGTFGSTLSLTTSGGSSSGALSYVVNSGPCTVSGSTLSNSAAGTCSVTATMAGGDNYNNVSSSATNITIAKADQIAISSPVLNVSTKTPPFSQALTVSVSGGSGTGALTIASVVNGTAQGCTLTGSTLTATSSGTCTLTITKAGDDNYNATSTTTTFTFGAGTQTVTWSPTTALSATASPATVTAATALDSATITYAVQSAGTTGCTVNSTTAELTFTTAGSCVVRATAASTASYSSATTDVTFVISLVSRTLTINSGSFVSTYGMVAAPPTIASTASAGSGTVTYSSSTAAVCTINSSSGVVAFVAPGTCTIGASIAATATHAAATASTISFAVTSSTATLSGLTLSSGTLSPTFASSTFAYTALVLFAVSGLTVTPTRSQSGATIQVKLGSGSFASVTSGSASASLAMAEGLNTVTILVTAQDGVTTETYTIGITKGPISTNNNLSSLTFSAGRLLQVFSPSVLSYNLSVPNSVSSLTFTATAQDTTADIKVGSTSITSGTASGSYSVIVGVSFLNIVVTAQDGVTTKTYAITFTRAPPTWLVLAAGERDKIFTATTANGTTASNGSHFYFGGGSMGFSPNSTIVQNTADTSDTNCSSTTAKQRLSWHFNGTNITAGWRAGCITGNSNRFQRAIYQSDTVPSYYPSGPQQSVTTTSVESGGWSLCWVGRYNVTFSITEVRAACTGTYLLLSGGYMLTATYNANDGSGSPSTNVVSVPFDSSITLTANTFTRSGHTFNGWSSAADGSGTQYTNSQTGVFLVSSNTNFFAKWVSNVTVTFNANDGSGSPATTTQGIGTGIATALTANSFTRAGYTFGGWTANSDGSGTAYTNSQSVTFNSNTQIFAKWNPISYTVTYNLNSGTGTAPTQGTRTIGQTFKVAAATGITRTGHSFGGWSDGASTYQPDSDYTVGSNNVVLLAQWNLDSYTITYSANNGTGSAARTSDTFIFGSAAIVLPGRGTLARTGYSFAGWATSSGGTAIVGTYTPTQSATLYAVWSPNTYTITFNGNGATGSPASSTTTYTTGASGLALTNTQGTLAKIGHDFAGWATSANGTAVNTPYTTSESLTLYAVWTPIGYTVTYDLAGGNSSLPVQATQNFNQTFTLAAAATRAANTDPVHDWAFVAWSDGSNQYSAGSTYRMGTSNVTLTAVWIRVFTVKYTMNGAQTAAPADVFSSDGASVTLAAAPVRTGFTFTGWRNQSNSNFSAGASMPISLTSYLVYAQWSAIDYQVTYDLNGGTSSQPSSSTVNIGGTVTVTSAPTRAGHVFNGWSYNSLLYGPGATVIASAADVPFVASWTAINYNVTYDMNGSATTRPTVSSKTIGQTFVLATSPSRSGYTFSGWNDGTNVVNAGSTYTVGSSDVTLAATWTAVNYTLTYDVNGGNSTAPSGSTTLNIGQSFTVASAATHANRTFLGWSDGQNIYAPGQSYVVGASNVTLSAYWSGINYNIVYDLNGGSGTTPVEGVKQSGESFTVKAGTGFTRTNYTFAGWKIGSQSVAVNDLISVASSDVTLIAQWTPAFVVSFTSNGGSSVSSLTYTGTALAKPSNPTRENFVFEAWTDQDGIDVVWPLAPAGPITLGARWTQLSLYGLNPSSLSRFGTLNAQSGVAATFTGSNSESSVTVTVPAGSLPDGTTVNIDLVSETSRAQGVIPGQNNYIISFVVSWLAPDGTVPATASGKEISMTINNSLIKAGAAIYSVLGTTATFLTRATQNGTVTISIAVDPEIVVAITKPESPTNVSGTSSVTTELIVSWTAPSVDGGSPITLYTATTTSGASCTSTTTSCTIRNLTAGTSYTFSVTATNTIGTSAASSSATARTASAVSGGSGGGGGGGGGSSAPAPAEPSASTPPVRSNVTVIAPVTVVGDSTAKIPAVEIMTPVAGTNAQPPVIKIDAASDKFIAEVKVVEGKLTLTPEVGFSGRKTVTVTITENGTDRIVQIPLTVLPEPVAKPALTPMASNRSLIRWTESPNATAYTVLLNGKRICSTSASSCSVRQVLGPNAVIEIVSTGGDRTFSQRVEADFRQNVPVPITRLVSATNTKATLTRVDTKALDSVVALIRTQGFGTVVISEISTNQRTAPLAAARIAAIKKYIDDRTGNREITFEIVPPTSRTTFNNIAVKG